MDVGFVYNGDVGSSEILNGAGASGAFLAEGASKVTEGASKVVV